MGDPLCQGVDSLTTADREQTIHDYLKPYISEKGTFHKVADLLLQEMEKGLGKETNATAAVKMFPTYVRSLPDGTEDGNFLALDLGGTNFRVLLITLSGDKVDMKSKIYLISQSIMTGTGTQLFDHIAECIAKFMEDNHLIGLNLPLGFTFSFPLKQEGLDVGRLVHWTKGFNCSGVEGEDVVKLLHEAIARRNDIKVKCVAILNDTVGTLMSCAFTDHNCEIGLILGTGTNACYMEKLDKVELWDADHDEPKQVIINTEWGAFGDNGVLEFVRTKEDIEIDKSSLNPGKQLYEKMISGMYMGEIVRKITLHCAERKLIFKGQITKELETPNRFYTKYVSEIESDEEGSYTKAEQVLEEMGYKEDDYDKTDLKHLRLICQAVSIRAANLASAGVATLLNRINKPSITVGVDGSLFRYHPMFRELMVDKIKQLVNPNIEFKLMLSEDGSGKGAALVAAVAHRVQQATQTS